MALAWTVCGVAASVPLRASDIFQSIGEEVNALFERSQSAVVQVQSGDGSVTLAGTGFFIDDKGTILTSSTVIGDNTTARVEINGEEMPARILGDDPRSGLAELQVAENGTPSLPLGESIDLKTGYSVLAIGYPLNLPVAPSQGLVSGFDVRYLNQFFATTHIHVNLSISPGEVGGPLLDIPKGEVVGLVVPSLDDGRSIYALPVEAINKILGDFSQYGRAKHGWVGVDVVERPDTRHDGRTVQVLQPRRRPDDRGGAPQRDALQLHLRRHRAPQRTRHDAARRHPDDDGRERHGLPGRGELAIEGVITGAYKSVSAKFASFICAFSRPILSGWFP
jgi:S1-C subfamily serine protease